MTGFASDLRVSGADPRPLVQWRSAILPSVIVAILATAAMVGGNAGGRSALAGVVIALQVIFAFAWLLRFSMPVDAFVLVAAGVAVTDVVLLRTRSASAGSIAGVLGLSVIAVLFHQIARRGARSVTEAVAITISAIALAAASALLLPLRELADGRSMVLAGLVTAGSALVAVRVIPGPDLLRRLAGLVVAALVGLWCGAPNGGILTTADGIYLGLATGAAVLLLERLLSRIDAPATSPGRQAQLFTGVVNGLVPLFLAAPVVYLVGRAVTSGSFAYVAGHVLSPGGG